MLVWCSLTGLSKTRKHRQCGSGQGTDPVEWTCMTGQRVQKEWANKASRGRVEREAAIKCTQRYLICAQLTALSLLHFSGVTFEGDYS